MVFLIIKIESKTWDEMWDWIADHPINEGYDEPSLVPNEGYGWQYIGTYKSNDGRAISEFKHKLHPRFDRVESLTYIHENGIPELDIEKVIPIK